MLCVLIRIASILDYIHQLSALFVGLSSLEYQAYLYGKPFNYLFYKSDIWLNISDILYDI